MVYFRVSSKNERVLRDVLNSAQCRGLELNWAGTDSHLFLRGVVENFEVVVAPARSYDANGNPVDAEGLVEVAVYKLGAFDEGRVHVTVLERLDAYDAAAAAWLLGVAYRDGNWAPKKLVG